MNTDVTIVGAGIVGLATAYQMVQQEPDVRVCVLEKEADVAVHQSSHNSGVIHSGIYYRPGGDKARNCATGYRLLLDFCQEYEIPHELCGKVIVATEEREIPLMDNIYQRGIANGLKNLAILDRHELQDKEPYVQGIQGIWVPQAGIIDYHSVAQKYADLIQAAGGHIKLGHRVVSITPNAQGIRIRTTADTIHSKILVNCSGLYADKVAKMTGQEIDFKILPFRGEYYQLKPEKTSMVNGLIYPIPNPNFPFLGVHFTKMIKGGVEAGPNAVLAFGREGYRKRNLHPAELLETLAYPGFLRIARKYWKDGSYEMYRSFSKKAFVKALQKLIPTLSGADVIKGGSGVRAQACDRQGNLIDDYLILEQPGIINLCNAPSPAATASLAIGAHLAEKVFGQLERI